MRLLNSETMQMSLCNLRPGRYERPYAVLSHTWGDEEVSFQDFQRADRASKKGFDKIVACCKQAREDGIEWVWIDTCCIDKTNSAELSEAINSMYSWYWHSTVCYAYLEDVPPLGLTFPKHQFEHARWFKRGWCLQELIAPSKVEFFAQDWSDIGTKLSLRHLIFDITGIPMPVLLERNVGEYSAAERMSWASTRETTRVEDTAYCLMGLFDINMPLLYGEGKKAFLRLQGEILSHREDYSLLLWTATERWTWGHEGTERTSCAVLAPEPSYFHRSGVVISGVTRRSYTDIKRIHTVFTLSMEKGLEWASRNPLQLTSRGLQIEMPMTGALPGRPHNLLLWTGHGDVGNDQYVCIELVHVLNPDGTVTADRVTPGEITLVNGHELAKFSLQTLYLTMNRRVHSSDLFLPPEYSTRAENDLGVVFSSVCQANITFLDSNPSLSLSGMQKEATSDNLSSYSMLYCPGIEIANPGTTLVGQKHSMRFERRGRDPEGESKVDHFQIDAWFGVSDTHPRCCVFPIAGSEVGRFGIDSHSRDRLPIGVPNEQNPDDLSDRSRCLLPYSQCIVTVAVKRNGQFFMSPTPKGQWPAVFMLYIRDVGKA